MSDELADELGGAVRSGARWTEELLATLVACPSATGQPSAIAEVLLPVLHDLGLRVEVHPVDSDALADHPEYSPPDRVDGRQSPVLVANSPGEAAPELLLFAHTDTEPVHDGWTSDPFAMRIENGRAIGLGVADDKAGVVAILAAIRAVQLSGQAMTRRPRVVLGSGKQGGALGTLPGTIAAAGVTGAVYSHPAESGYGLTHLKIASRGIVQVEVTVDGLTPVPLEERTPVSADPRQGRSAAERAARLASAITGHDDGVIRSVTGLQSAGRPYEVPSTARLVVANWFAEGTVTSVVAGLEELLGSAARDDWERDHPPHLRVIGLRANPATCAGTPFAEWASATVTDVTAEPVTGYDWHSASDIRFPMRCLGVPAVGFGATAGQFYGPGEWVDLASLAQSIAVLARMLTA